MVIRTKVPVNAGEQRMMMACSMNLPFVGRSYRAGVDRIFEYFLTELTVYSDPVLSSVQSGASSLSLTFSCITLTLADPWLLE